MIRQDLASLSNSSHNLTSKGNHTKSIAHPALPVHQSRDNCSVFLSRGEESWEPVGWGGVGVGGSGLVGLGGRGGGEGGVGEMGEGGGRRLATVNDSSIWPELWWRFVVNHLLCHAVITGR